MTSDANDLRMRVWAILIAPPHPYAIVQTKRRPLGELPPEPAPSAGDVRRAKAIRARRGKVRAAIATLRNYVRVAATPVDARFVGLDKSLAAIERSVSDLEGALDVLDKQIRQHAPIQTKLATRRRMPTDKRLAGGRHAGDHRLGQLVRQQPPSRG